MFEETECPKSHQDPSNTQVSLLLHRILWQQSHCFPKLQYGTVMLASRSGRWKSWFGGSGPRGKAGAIEAHVHRILGNSNRPAIEP